MDSVWREIKSGKFNYQEYKKECEMNVGEKFFSERRVMIEVARDILEEVNSNCELYPTDDDEGCVCGAGSDISGHVCTIDDQIKCPWYHEEMLRRVKDE